MNGLIGYMSGIKVMTSDMLPLFKDVQCKFPKSKRKRLRKKWSKNMLNYKKVENNDGYMMGDVFVCNSRTANALMESGKITRPSHDQ